MKDLLNIKVFIYLLFSCAMGIAYMSGFTLDKDYDGYGNKIGLFFVIIPALIGTICLYGEILQSTLKSSVKRFLSATPFVAYVILMFLFMPEKFLASDAMLYLIFTGVQTFALFTTTFSKKSTLDETLNDALRATLSVNNVEVNSAT